MRKFEKVSYDDSGIIPTRNDKGSAGYDFYDNEGNIIGALFNYGNETQVIKAGERVMQGVLFKYLTTDDDKPLNEERVGGIGSSGK